MEALISRGKDKVMMIRMSRKEAMLTIQSLAAQIVANNSNVGRYECYFKDGTDFSIAVTPEEPR